MPNFAPVTECGSLNRRSCRMRIGFVTLLFLIACEDGRNGAAVDMHASTMRTAVSAPLPSYMSLLAKFAAASDAVVAISETLVAAQDVLPLRVSDATSSRWIGVDGQVILRIVDNGSMCTERGRRLEVFDVGGAPPWTIPLTHACATVAANLATYAAARIAVLRRLKATPSAAWRPLTSDHYAVIQYGNSAGAGGVSLRVPADVAAHVEAVLAVDGFQDMPVTRHQPVVHCSPGSVGGVAAVGASVYVNMDHGVGLVESQLDITNDACSADAPAYVTRLIRRK
jgi:hypothetical protein